MTPLHTALRRVQARRRRANSRTAWTMLCHQESRLRAEIKELKDAGIVKGKRK